MIKCQIILFSILSMFSIVNLLAQDNKCISKAVKVCPDTIVVLSKYINDTTGLRAEIRKLKSASVHIVVPVEKFNIEIDRFLNSEKMSVFSTDFMDLPDSLIHPRSQNYYHLICNIRTLANLLLKNDLTTIRADLDEMGKLIEKINDAEKNPKNLLPIPLLDYYKSLVKKYGIIYDQIFPDK